MVRQPKPLGQHFYIVILEYNFQYIIQYNIDLLNRGFPNGGSRPKRGPRKVSDGPQNNFKKLLVVGRGVRFLNEHFSYFEKLINY